METEMPRRVRNSSPATPLAQAAPEVNAAQASAAEGLPALTVTTAFRTVEIPIPPGGDIALAVETAKLIVLTDLLRETPEEREKRLREADHLAQERQEAYRKAREEAERRLQSVLEGLHQAKAEAGRVHAQVAEALAPLQDEGALQALAGHIGRVVDATLVRNVVLAWAAEDLAAALQRDAAGLLWTLAKRTVEGWRFPEGEMQIPV